MKITIIVNGISRKKKYFYKHILPTIQNRYQVNVFETKFQNHAFELAREASMNGEDIVISAGGDGTLNQVLNGIIQNENTIPILGVIPLGSGNDFAAMVNARMNADAIIQLLEQNKTRELDIGKIVCQSEDGQSVVKYFINVCSLGMGPATVKRVEKLPRWLGTGLRYYISVLNTFLTHSIDEFEVKTSSWSWKGRARVVAIANGNSFGNKIFIAPQAKPDDGIFSSFVATDMSLLKFLPTLQQIKNKMIVKDPAIVYNTATEFELSSPHEALIEAEGEMAGYLPAKIFMLEKKVKILA